MRKRIVFLMIAFLMLAVVAEAKFLGWGKEWNYLSKEGNCIVEYSIQHYYLFGFDIGLSKEVEVSRTCVE